MSEAACAEEEENLRAAVSQATVAMVTVRRAADGQLAIRPEAFVKSNEHARKALQFLRKAHDELLGNITGGTA